LGRPPQGGNYYSQGGTPVNKKSIAVEERDFFIGLFYQPKKNVNFDKIDIMNHTFVESIFSQNVLFRLDTGQDFCENRYVCLKKGLNGFYNPTLSGSYSISSGNKRKWFSP
jgi:hypothetical protein